YRREGGEAGLSPLVSDAADNGSFDAVNRVRSVAEALDLRDHTLDLGIRRARVHHDDHSSELTATQESCQAMPPHAWLRFKTTDDASAPPAGPALSFGAPRDI